MKTNTPPKRAKSTNQASKQTTSERYTVRISKYFTDCGVLSRRAAEAAILQGEVTVNGARAVLGQQILPGADTVLYRGVPVRPRQPNVPHRYIMLHKPRGYVTTLSDEKGRKSVASLCASVGSRVYPVGRLDMDSEGLLLLTDDGAFAQSLTHPSHSIAKYYQVTLGGQVEDAKLTALAAPHLLDGYETHPITVTLLERKADRTLVGMTLFEGRNRQIRKICAAHGLSVLRLRRTALLCPDGSAVKLGTLPLGQWRDLTRQEVRLLTEQRQSKQKGKENHAGSTSDTE